jgi:hypothetical protein
MRNLKAITYKQEIPSSIKKLFSKLIYKTILKDIKIAFINALVFSLITLSNPIPALANPQGGQVEDGVATIQQAPNSTTTNQASQQAIINRQSFNIGSKASVGGYH